jgi:heterodisulfide reductase subunit C
MTSEMVLKPHDIVRMVHMNQEIVLEHESIWLCLTCETCSARCPNEVEPARIVDTVRELSLEGGGRAPRPIRAFHTAFLKQIRRSGRVFEFGLVAGFKMRSGLLFNDVGAVPGMLKRGKLALTPRRIKGLEDIRRIFEECQAVDVPGTPAAHEEVQG